MSNSGPMPRPVAVTIDWISRFEDLLIGSSRVDHLAPEEDGLEVVVARVDRGPPAELPSTRYTAALRVGRLAWQAAGRPPPASALAGDLAAARGLPGPGGVDRLRDDLLRSLGSRGGTRRLLVHDLLHEAAHPRVAELRLGLPLELRLPGLSEITAASPSRTSSPSRFASFSLTGPRRERTC